jgi:zinc protease
MAPPPPPTATPPRKRAMKHTPPLLPFLVVAMTFAAPLPLQPQAPGTPGAIPFESYHLENGLHVILAPDESSTAVAVNIWYRVGSRNERPGRSGFAHLFEHLMFQGSENVAAGDHFQLVERAGGNLNATVNDDRTLYFQTMPPERLNLALWLESDRMRSLQVTEENMAREVEVVKEERRLRIDNSPYGTSQLQVSNYAVYDSASCFAYAHSVIGSMDDLDAAELPDVQAFFDLYYAPNNATLTIVGDFDPAVVRELVQRYFGGIPRGADPPEVRCEEPFSHLPVEMRVHDTNATLPGVWMAYGTVATADADAPALEVLARILGVGQSSRLNQRLVREEQAALDAASFPDLRLDPGILIVLAIANQGVEPERLLELLDEEVDRIRREGVTPGELERARNQVRSGVIMGRQSVMGRAEALQGANFYHGTPEAAADAVERIAAVTAEDVRRVAERYLNPENRAVVFTIPGPAPEEDR